MKALAALIVAVLTLAACQNSPPPVANNEPTPPTRPRSTPNDLFPDLADFDPWITRSGGCVTDREISAEQFIQVHTALMVTGLTCPTAFQDPYLFNQYQTFTVNHQTRILEIQSLLGRYLAQHQYGNGSRLFDTYRTQIANDESQLVIQVSAGRYCQSQRNRFYHIAQLDSVELDAFIAEAVDRYREDYNTCG